MKTAGIIAEYNPFHMGHQYHIEETKRLTGADYIIAVMSGDFVQRGAPAFMDKYDRAACALAGGCDLVLELPVIYSSSSAEFFASGAVKLLDCLNVCDFLSFGSEDGTLESLIFLSDLLSQEPEDYKLFLKVGLKSGLSFPAAREKALNEYLTIHSDTPDIQKPSEFLKGSNNILGLEYLKALKKYDSSIQPITIARKNAGYHDTNVYNTISSASAIRSFSQKNLQWENLKTTVPVKTWETMNHLKKQGGIFPDYDHLTPYLHLALIRETNPELYLDWDIELANRLRQTAWEGLSFTELADRLKCRNVTLTRVYRALLHLILGIKKERFFMQYEQCPIPYARILGFRKGSSPLIRRIKESSDFPLITKPASILKEVETEDLWVWQQDLAAAQLYQSILSSGGHKTVSAYQRNPVIL